MWERTGRSGESTALDQVVFWDVGLTGTVLANWDELVTLDREGVVDSIVSPRRYGAV